MLYQILFRNLASKLKLLNMEVKDLNRLNLCWSRKREPAYETLIYYDSSISYASISPDDKLLIPT